MYIFFVPHFTQRKCQDAIIYCKILLSKDKNGGVSHNKCEFILGVLDLRVHGIRPEQTTDLSISTL